MRNIRWGMGTTGCFVEAGAGWENKGLPGTGGDCSCIGWKRYTDFS